MVLGIQSWGHPIWLVIGVSKERSLGGGSSDQASGVHMSAEWSVWQLAGKQKSISGQTRGFLFWWEVAGHQCLASCSGVTGRQVEREGWAQIITSSLGRKPHVLSVVWTSFLSYFAH